MIDATVKVWIIDDDAAIRWVLEEALRDAGLACQAFDNSGAFLAALKHERPDVVVTDLRMRGKDGFELLEHIHARHVDLPVIMMTAHSDLDTAVTAYQRGAFEYLPKPFDLDEAVELVRRAARQYAVGNRAVVPEVSFPSLIGRAPAMQEMFRAIGRLSRSSMTVLVTGESGTGKELVAAALHQHSPRSGRPFIALNTSAIPHELLESELFGHEKGSFTGADRRRFGRFEQADGGTLFLDEIGDMPLELQTRLLRVLAEGEFYRVGGQDPVQVDVRVIAATHQDLESRVASGQFREDLFHRLNVIQITVPPLRERREDIANLLQHYLAEAARELSVPTKTMSENAQAALMQNDWPGNVRQLINVCRRLTALAPGREIRLRDLPPELGGGTTAPAPLAEWTDGLERWATLEITAGRAPLLNQAQAEFERTLIVTALRETGGRRQRAAKLLGWGRNTLTRKIHELGLD